MKLTLEARNKHLISGYEAGEVRINDLVIRNHCLITADSVLEWPLADKQTNQLHVNDMQPIAELNPEVVLLGMSGEQRYPSAEIYALFLERNIGFEVMDIGAACRTFNILLGEDRRVVAALMLTAV
ncbi:MAG TPA: MTH938/NDUFAF3 family protein [Steroidobacteraceae bacterium]|jgi:uncharacterized protein|nr:MTH938/NDUFAF3 family protein [Steroidobacteraceae bacterium]